MPKYVIEREIPGAGKLSAQELQGTSLPKKIMDSLVQEVHNQLRLATAIKHPGESGRARENALAAFIRRLVPRSFGVDTGFVIDSQGEISRQIDIVIYRTDYHPVFEIGGVKHFLVESVVAVIENKARITTRAQLKSALENIRSVKKLDRSNQGGNKIVRADESGPVVSKSEFKHQVFGAIVTQKSLSKPKLSQELLNYLRSSDRTVWFNLYIDVNSFTASYSKKRKEGDSVSSAEDTLATVVPSEAERLYITDKADPNFVPPLADLAQELVNLLRVAPLIDFLPTAYLWKQTGKLTWYKI